MASYDHERGKSNASGSASLQEAKVRPRYVTFFAIAAMIVSPAATATQSRYRNGEFGISLTLPPFQWSCGLQDHDRHGFALYLSPRGGKRCGAVVKPRARQIGLFMAYDAEERSSAGKVLENYCPECIESGRLFRQLDVRQAEVKTGETRMDGWLHRVVAVKPLCERPMARKGISHILLLDTDDMHLKQDAAVFRSMVYSINVCSSIR
jgi:hypothetical protein